MNKLSSSLPSATINNIIDYLPLYKQINIDTTRTEQIQKIAINKIINWWKNKSLLIEMAYEYMEPIELVKSYMIIKYPKEQRFKFIINSFTYLSDKYRTLIINELNNDINHNLIFKNLIKKLDLTQILKIQSINSLYFDY